MAIVTSGRALLALVSGSMATLAVLMHVIAGLAHFMTGGALGLLAGSVRSLGSVSILGMMALTTLHHPLMGLVTEGNLGATLFGGIEGDGFGTTGRGTGNGNATDHGQCSNTKGNLLEHFNLLKVKNY